MGMTHLALIDSWPSLTAFAVDIGVAYGTAKAIRRRGWVPPEYWAAAVRGANARGISGVTYEQLAELVEARRPMADVAGEAAA